MGSSMCGHETICQKVPMKRRRLDLARDYERVLAIHRLSWAINFPNEQFNEDVFGSWLCSGARRDRVYVYEIENELVGWLWLDLSAPRRSCHIRHIQVEQAYWGRGFGRRIMEDAIAMCVEQGCRKVTLNVTKHNKPAMALYIHLGFMVVEDCGERQRMKLDISKRSRPRSGGRSY